jgi:hypothetical protein
MLDSKQLSPMVHPVEEKDETPNETRPHRAHQTLQPAIDASLTKLVAFSPDTMFGFKMATCILMRIP